MSKINVSNSIDVGKPISLSNNSKKIPTSFSPYSTDDIFDPMHQKGNWLENPFKKNNKNSNASSKELEVVNLATAGTNIGLIGLINIDKSINDYKSGKITDEEFVSRYNKYKKHLIDTKEAIDDDFMGPNEFLKMIKNDSASIKLSSSEEELVKYLNKLEGCASMAGDYYEVTDVGDGCRTVGYGITLENTATFFEKYGIDVSKYGVGSKLPKYIVDNVKKEVVLYFKGDIQKNLADNGIKLEEQQENALTVFAYNCGWGEEISNDFIEAYKTYGNSPDLYYNFFGKYIYYESTDGELVASTGPYGLEGRRKSEWNLFMTGEYVDDGNVEI